MTWFEHIPLIVVFLLTVVIVILAITLGERLAAFGSKLQANETEEAIGPMVGATLGLLAFILAFTFGMASSRFDARKQLLIDEVNAIGTAYLRAGILPLSYQTETRKLLDEYVDVRIRRSRDLVTLNETMTISESIHNALWKQAEQMSTQEHITIAQSLYIQALNEVIDLYGERIIVGLQHRIPVTIWFGLYAVAFFAMMAVGYQFGRSRRPQIFVSIILAMSFSLVITLIADLDRAGEGTVRLSQQPFFDLQQKIQERQHDQIDTNDKCGP